MPTGGFLIAEGRLGPGPWTSQERETLLALAGVGDDALRAAELITQLQTITDAQTEAVVAFDGDGCVTFANPAAVRMLRASSDADVVGRGITDTFTMRADGEELDLLELMRAGTVVQDGDATMYTARGNRIEAAYSLSPLTDTDDDGGAVMVIRDVSERRAFQEALTYRALHDELTGLPNRRLFLDRVDELLAGSARDGGQHAVVFVDVDRFKLVNDSFGHLVGDQLLIQMSDRLQRLVMPSDTMARLAGDEFVILVDGSVGDRNIPELAERMLSYLREPYRIEGNTVLATVSIGVAVTAPGDARDDVMLAADAATYAAKSAGRNCIRFATQQMVDATRERLEMESRLRDAIDKEHLTLRYQPIVDTKTRELAGVEALVRWDPPDSATIPPNEFIPLAEDTGLIVFLGRWVLEEACRVTHHWNTTHPERGPIVVSVNLSALQLAQPRLADEVQEVLNRTALPPEHLCLEITETAVLSDTQANVQTLHELREIGVRVAVDDFGTGYSSLAYLRSLPVDVVKLDAAFIAGLGQDMVDTQIVAAVLRLCKALGRRTVAEGVESEMQWRTLARMGCPFMQGYLIARPMRRDEFERYWDSLHPRRLRVVEI
jgi:Amt family ammonium transporter